MNALGAMLVMSVLATPLDDLIEHVQPEYEDIEALGTEAQKLFSVAHGHTPGSEGIAAADAFAALPRATQSMQVWAAATSARREVYGDDLPKAIAKLTTLAEDLSEFPELAMLARLEIGRIMSHSGGPTRDFNPTIVEIQEVYEPVFAEYSPYSYHLLKGHSIFAEECSDASQQPIYWGYADLAVRHYERALAIIDEVEADPSLVPERVQRHMMLAQRARWVSRLDNMIQRRDRKRDEADLFPLVLESTDNVPPPDSCERTAIRAIIAADALIDAATAESLAVHCDAITLALLGDYLKPTLPIASQTNAVHVISFMPHGLTVSWAFDKIFNRQPADPKLERAIAEHVNPYNILLRTTHYGGRAEAFARIYGLDAVPAIRRALSWNGPPRAQRNAAAFASAFPNDAVRDSLRERLMTIPDFITEAGDHPLRDTFTALGTIGRSEDIALLAGMATTAYWEKRGIPEWEPYRREGWSITESRDRWRYDALLGLRQSKLSEARDHLRRLRKSGANDLEDW